jgi:hypothetical protein
MPERFFLFVQMELPWELGPADGRWLLRSPDGEVERVLVLGTVGAERRRGRGRARRGRGLSAAPIPTVPVTRATSIDPVPLSAERQGQSWLHSLDAERETLAAFEVLNRVLFAHRIVSADPYTHEAFPSQALAIRAGYGQGEQVADGRFSEARELQWIEPRARRRVAALRPQERLAMLLGSRAEILQCEEHVLRARLDLDHGRLALAAIELERAYLTGLPELARERRSDLAGRLAELEQLRPGVIASADAVLLRSDDQRSSVAQGAAGETHESGAELDEELLRHALGRLEAALRARTASGFGDRS